MPTATQREAGTPGTSGNGSHAARLRQHARQARREGQALAGSAREALHELSGVAQEQLEVRPYPLLGAAFGVGWLLGGGIPLRLVVFAGGIGVRLAAQELLRSLRSDPESERRTA